MLAPPDEFAILSCVSGSLLRVRQMSVLLSNRAPEKTGRGQNKNKALFGYSDPIDYPIYWPFRPNLAIST